MKLMPRASASSTTRRDASKSMRPPKLLPPSPITDTSSAELPSLRICMTGSPRDGFDLPRLARAHDRVEHRHAVQHVLDRHRIGRLVADRARERGKLGVEHVEALVLTELVGRRSDRAGRRLRRGRYEAEALQV